MKLYYSKAACSLAVRIIINELNLACEFIAVDIRTKKTQDNHDYFTINPKGAVPALALDDGQILTENLVIQVYLAEKNQAHQLLAPTGNFQRYRTLEWLNFVSTELHKGIGVFFNEAIPAEVKQQVYLPMLFKKLEVVDNQLAKQQFLAGDHFTLADGYLFVVTSWLNFLKIDASKFQHLMRYYENLTQRPSIMKSLREEELIK